MSGVRIPIIHTLSALDSLREIGITFDNGLLELVDNPIDWSATRIHVHIIKWPDGTITTIVADNGAGIPEWVTVDPSDRQNLQASDEGR